MLLNKGNQNHKANNNAINEISGQVEEELIECQKINYKKKRLLMIFFFIFGFNSY